MAQFDKIFSCINCDYKTKKLFNLNRHMVSKHPAEKVTDFTEKVTDFAEKVTDFTEKVTDLEGIPTFKCDKCDKIFNRQYNLKVHIETCRGEVNSLECNHCNKKFKCKQNKSEHLKICKNKQSTINNNSNSVINSNNTTNNIKTQNVQNIIVFATDSDESKFNTIEFQNKIKELLKGNTDNISIIKDYNKGIMNIPENQCIKKSSLKTAHSQIHIGDNEWKTKSDKEVYPQMVCNLANSLLSDLEKLKIKRKELDKVLDCIIDKGYINDTDDKHNEMIRNFTELSRDLKYLMYDITKIKTKNC